MPTLMGADESRATGVVANRGAGVRRGTRSGVPTARAALIVAGRTPGPGRRGAAERSGIADRAADAVAPRDEHGARRRATLPCVPYVGDRPLIASVPTIGMAR